MNIPSVIIGIILSALAVGIGASFYGDFFSDGSTRAISATASNEAQQILNSVDLYKTRNNGQAPVNTTTGELDLQILQDEDYLETIPKDWSLSANSLEKGNDDLSNNACIEMNQSIGIDQETIPQCGDSILDGKRFYCCESS